MKNTTRAMEEAGVRAAGFKLEWIAPILVVLGLLLVVFILLKLKILTWLMLGLLNIGFLSYWIYAMQKTPSVSIADHPDPSAPQSVYHNSPERANKVVAGKKVHTKAIFA